MKRTILVLTLTFILLLPSPATMRAQANGSDEDDDSTLVVGKSYGSLSPTTQMILWLIGVGL